MSAGISKTDSIRQALRDGDGPMTKDQVCDAVPDSVDRATVSALLQQRTKAGEFKVEIVDGKPQYSINPNGAKAAKNASSKSPITFGRVAHGTLPAKPASDSSHAKPANTEAAKADTAKAAAHAPTLPSKPTRTVHDSFGLIERMDVIGKDLDDALVDAIDAEVPGNVLRELVIARAGITAALIKTLRN